MYQAFLHFKIFVQALWAEKNNEHDCFLALTQIRSPNISGIIHFGPSISHKSIKLFGNKWYCKSIIVLLNFVFKFFIDFYLSFFLLFENVIYVNSWFSHLYPPQLYLDLPSINYPLNYKFSLSLSLFLLLSPVSVTWIFMGMEPFMGVEPFTSGHEPKEKWLFFLPVVAIKLQQRLKNGQRCQGPPLTMLMILLISLILNETIEKAISYPDNTPLFLCLSMPFYKVFSKP